MDNVTRQEFLKSVEDRNKLIQKMKDDSPSTKLVSDFFVRFHRDKNAQCNQDEVEVTDAWKIVFQDSTPVLKLMADHLADFFVRCMDIPLEVTFSNTIDSIELPAIILRVSQAAKPESFSIAVSYDEIIITGADPSGVRNGVVRIIGLFGLRMAPYLQFNKTLYTPRNELRMAFLDSVQNDVFYGSNAAMLGNAELYALSDSELIPELIERRNPTLLNEFIKKAKTAEAYSLKKYINLATMEKFKLNDSIFENHPDIKGALTFSKDGDYTLCSQSPLVRKYIFESIEGLFRNIPGLDGIIVIIGGEAFYHCFTRAYGVERGHTNCLRCEALGAELVVSDLCNLIAEAARSVNPNAEVIAWPYSAAAVWSEDDAQLGFIRKLKPGVSIMTEAEKDEIIYKPGGVSKRMWDYSIDMEGLGRRAQAQLAEQAPIHILTMAGMSFEDSLLPMMPVHDRWARRAEALAASGAKGVYLFDITPFHGLSSAEIYQYKWFSPSMSDEDLLCKLAKRITGDACAGQLLRQAWREASNGFNYMPFINSYFFGPQYLGPAHPVVLDISETMPEVYKGYHLHNLESNLDAVINNPVFSCDQNVSNHIDCPGDKGIPILEIYYRVAEAYLVRAVNAVSEARKLIPPEHSMLFEAETSPIQWFYHTLRTCGNLFELNRVLNELKEMHDKGGEKVKRHFSRLREILLDEKQNTLLSLPIAQKDARLEIQRGDFSFYSLVNMMNAKLDLLEKQITERLPEIMRNYK